MPAKPGHRTAVALEYDPRTADAPSVSAKGEYLNADEVVKIARRYGVPVVERPALARALLALDLDQPIPQDMFEAVAAVLHEVDQVYAPRRR